MVKGKQEDGRNSGFLVVKKNVPIFGVSGLNLDRRRGSDWQGGEGGFTIYTNEVDRVIVKGKNGTEYDDECIDAIRRNMINLAFLYKVLDIN